MTWQAIEAAEKAGAAICGEEGAACGKTAGEAAARDIAARLGRDLGAVAGEVTMGDIESRDLSMIYDL